MLARAWTDLGLSGAASGPVWLRDNPFLTKSSRAETRRLGISLRLLVTLLILSVLLLGGLWLNGTYGTALNPVTAVFFGGGFAPALFIILTFVHTFLIGNARAATAVSVADEARRGTLPDLLLTPLRRAEMLLAMGVGPARTAFLVALAGLPMYLLLAEFGLLSARDLVFLYLLFVWLCYAPPVYAFPALGGNALTPETALGQFHISRQRRPPRPNVYAGVALSAALGFMLVGQLFGLLRGGWLGHLLAALHLHFAPNLSFFLFFAWPYYAVQILSSRPDFFDISLPPLVVLVPLQLLAWAGSALTSAAALSAGDLQEMAVLPLAVRARTLVRWTARLAGLATLGLVWKPWVESGDTALLAGGQFGSPGWDAAGLLLLLGGLSLPNVCARALAMESCSRSFSLILRRAFKRAVRPLCVAGVTFLLACLLGGRSPLAAPVYRIAGQIALAGASSVLWAVGVRRCLPLTGRYAGILLYGLPVAALSLPLPGAAFLAALSPVSAWVRLFPDAAGLLTRFPLWTVAAPPSFAVCISGAALTGLALTGVAGWIKVASPPQFWGAGRGLEQKVLAADALISSPSPASQNWGGARPGPKSVAPRHLGPTAAFMGWITANTDNPLFTYEMRTRTRSGRWADGLLAAPVILLAAMVLGAAYPDIVNGVAFLSPFHFFINNPFVGTQPLPFVWVSLASLLLAGQCWGIGFRGQLIGEGLIARDRQRGIWGFLLLTPLTVREIFWGKVVGQTALPGALWVACSLGSLLLYGLASPSIGVGPALLVWGIGQAFVAALFLLGIGLGAALSTYPVFSRGLRGFSGILFATVVGLGVWGQYRLLPMNTPNDWQVLSGRLLLGTGYGLALAGPLFWFAEWRIAALRRRDITVGEGVE